MRWKWIENARRDKTPLFYSESPELNFSTLPDPFGSYIFRISPNDIATPAEMEASAKEFDHKNKCSAVPITPAQKPDQGLDHIEDPAMQTLMQREIAR